MWLLPLWGSNPQKTDCPELNLYHLQDEHGGWSKGWIDLQLAESECQWEGPGSLHFNMVPRCLSTEV